MTTRFVLPITAVASDIDELGHVSNQVYLRWILDVAMAHSRSLGWDHAQYLARGAAFVVRRHEIDYMAPVVVDQIISAETWIEDWRQASCSRRTLLLRDGKPVARATTTWAFITLASGRPTRVPEDIRELFAGSLQRE